MLDKEIQLKKYFLATLGRIPKRVGLLGLGKSNLALFEVLSGTREIGLTLRDSRETTALPTSSRELRIKLGRLYLDGIDEDILFLSPSVKRTFKELDEARVKGVLLSSDCEIFFEKKRPEPVFAVTGSDGKSTVTELTARLLNSSGVSAAAIGNIGTPYIVRPDADVYVTELSSFNLEYIAPLTDRAAITCITPNHLNWHGSFDEYVLAKKRILERTDRRVLSVDDPITRDIARHTESFAVFSSRSSLREMSSAYKAESYYSLSDGYILRNDKRIIAVDSLLRKEEYNLKNVMTALALSDGYTTADGIGSALTTFGGLQHRCELIYSKNGISVYDSSIDTTPERSASTIRALGKRVKLLLGGRGKGVSFEPLLDPILRYAEKISVYGEDKGEICELFSSHDLSSIPYRSFDLFEDAVRYLIEDLKHGDTVLLSPACTGYGEFSDFGERGDVFSRLINELII